MIKCYIVFNEETDREDWLTRCVDSLSHPDVDIDVRRYSTGACVRPRRAEILQGHDPSQWAMFADPDDVVVNPGYTNYVEFLKTTDLEAVYPYEVRRYELGNSNVWTGPHHLVAHRGSKLQELQQQSQVIYQILEGLDVFPEVAYQWNLHADNTVGGEKWR